MCIRDRNNEIITTLFVDRAESLVDRYKFIKGFKDGKEGLLDFYSSKKDEFQRLS